MGLALCSYAKATMISILCRGRFEVLKATVHGTALGVAAVCAAYNFSAWLVRRQRHSWINAVVYGTLTAWELHHVRHHLNCRVVNSEATAGEERAA